MHIEYLQYLVEVSNTGSISAAAKKLYLSQTSLSAIIASLEKDLNITFFNRTHRGVTVTPEGKQALEIIKDILARNEELHNSSNTAVNRIVNVASYPSVSDALSVYLARRLAEEHSAISLQIHELPYNRTFSAISEGLTHIAVAAEEVALNEINSEMARHDIEIEPLYEDRFYLITSSAFHLADRESVDISELLDERLAFTQVYPAAHDHDIAPVIRKFNKFVIFNNMSSLKQAVAENSAIAIVPGMALIGDYRKEAGLIRQIPVTGFTTRLTNYLLYEKPSNLSLAERGILDKIKAFYQTLPPSALKE